MTTHKLKLADGTEMTVVSVHKNVEDLKAMLTRDKGWVFVTGRSCF